MYSSEWWFWIVFMLKSFQPIVVSISAAAAASRKVPFFPFAFGSGERTPFNNNHQFLFHSSNSSLLARERASERERENTWNVCKNFNLTWVAFIIKCVRFVVDLMLGQMRETREHVIFSTIHPLIRFVLYIQNSAHSECENVHTPNKKIQLLKPYTQTRSLAHTHTNTRVSQLWIIGRWMNDFRSYKECKECIKKLNKVAAICKSVGSNFERTLAATKQKRERVRF